MDFEQSNDGEIIEFKSSVFIHWPFKKPPTDEELMEMGQNLTNIIGPVVHESYRKIIPKRIKLVSLKCSAPPAEQTKI